MSDRKNAAMMLTLAREDLAILEEIRHSARVSDRSVGFHAQQAVEKALKAWLAFVGVDYPKTHDLGELFVLLAEQGQAVPSAFLELDYLTDFAVLFRYTVTDLANEELDRASLVRRATEVVEYVQRLMGPSTA
jgi:HEPN domain-containing protein